MIDMRDLYSHSDYNSALAMFNSSNCKWTKFKDIHLKVAKYKCPICECHLNNTEEGLEHNGRFMKFSIDHYRPHDVNLYPLLNCDHKNYLLMCSDCNGCYKDNQFPLHSSGNTRDTTSITTNTITNERPLIVNPIYDDLLELFILVFRLTPSGKKVLELQPKETTGYLYEKAKESIRLFSLGNCEVDIHSSPNVQNCRIELLRDHFKKFFKFANMFLNNEEFSNAIINQDGTTIYNNPEYKDIYLDMKAKNLNKYGFYNFIIEKQFKVLVPNF
ncbi:MAG: hypothetical protein QM493_10210 [Sulfurovum sp.]